MTNEMMKNIGWPLALLVTGVVCGGLVSCDVKSELSDLARQKEAVIESIRTDYQRLSTLPSVIPARTKADYDHWRSTLESCDDSECLHEKLIHKKYEIEGWISLINPKLRLYQKSDFVEFWNAQDRYLPINGGGDIYDRATGLVWKRCMEGAYWNGSVCEGRIHAYLPSQFGERPKVGGWRVPQLFELMTLIVFNTSGPTIDQLAFPDQTSGHTWSATPFAGSPKEKGWEVNFGTGETGWGALKYTTAIRLVREPSLAELTKLINAPVPGQHAADQRPSFSCEAVLNHVESMICEDARLARYDSELDKLFATVKGIPLIDMEKLWHDQQLWIAIRNACGSALCIEKNYVEKFSELKKLANLFAGGAESAPIDSLSTLIYQKEGRFILDSDTVKDTSTGLTWKRCVEGMHWEGNACVGVPALYSLQEALAKFQDSDTNWRLPNLIELASIMDFERTTPAMDPETFPALRHDSMIAALGQKTGADFSGYIDRSQHTISTTLKVDFDRGYVTSGNYYSLVRLVKWAR